MCLSKNAQTLGLEALLTFHVSEEDFKTKLSSDFKWVTNTQAVFNSIATKSTPAANMWDHAKTHFLFMGSSPFAAAGVCVIILFWIKICPQILGSIKNLKNKYLSARSSTNTKAIG